MATDQFHEVFKDLGGRLDTAPLPPGPAELIRKLSGHADRRMANFEGLRRRPPIDFGVVDHPAVNAWAARDQGRYHIGISSGSIYVMQLVLFRLLADRRVLRGVGEPDEELENPPLLTGFRPQADTMFAAGHCPVPPQNEHRWRYASDLLVTALNFLFGHEYAHVINGHLDYLFPGTGTAAMAEVGAMPAGGRSVLARHVIEWDADQMAASVFGGGGIRRAFKALQKDPARSAADLDELRAAFTHWSFAVSTLCLVWGVPTFAGVELAQVAYPPVALRHRAVCQVVMDYMTVKWDPALREPAMAAMLSGIGEAIRGFEAVTGQVVDRAGLLEAADANRYSSHFDLMSENWKDWLRAELDAVAINENLPL